MSDRYGAARIALTAFEGATPERGYNDIDRYKLALIMADALRALVAPPHNHESLSDLALKIHTAALNAAEDAGVQITTDLDSIMRNATNRAVYTGMQRAHEVWEPEAALRPTQEQMLRWLGLDYRETTHGTLFVYGQNIDRED